MLRIKTLFGGFIFVFALFLRTIVCAAPITNEECMSCHGEKGLVTTGPGGEAVSLFFDTESFTKSVHSHLQCVGCHEVEAVPHAKLKAVSCQSCHEGSYGQYRGSVHRGGKGGKASCTDCHGYHTVQKTKTLTSAACADCHRVASRDYRAGIHARGTKGVKEVATCTDCHGSHYVLRVSDSRSAVHRLNLPRTCSRCHADAATVEKYKLPAQDAYTLYADSIHGRATRSGLLDSANCGDCHGAHAIKPRSDRTSLIYPTNVPSTCGKCHGDVKAVFHKSIHGQELVKGNQGAPSCASCHPPHQVQPVKAPAWVLDTIKECGSCHSALLETYRHTYHGKVTNLGFTRVAKCADCHGAHEVLPRSDPLSRISERNLLETCRQCHPGANKNFTEFSVHVDYKNKDARHGLYYVWLFMTFLLIGVFGFFSIHTILWLPRSWIERIREWRKRAGK